MNYLLFLKDKDNDKETLIPFHFLPSNEELDLFAKNCNIIKLFKLNDKTYNYELVIEL